jgi:hypothetical protein
MIEVLANLLPDFPGAANQTWCFAHILNLIAKTIIKQFDAPERREAEQLSGDEKLLAMLSDGLEVEEIETRFNAKDSDGETDDNDEGWVDKIELLSSEERKRLSAELVPIRLVIAKVRCL